MTKRIIQKRRPFLIACEGESEQAFVTWLKQEASNKDFFVCIQNPKLEALYLRMLGHKPDPNPKKIDGQLRKVWPEYKKPADAYTLDRKFTLQKLFNAAKTDPELSQLLSLIGFRN